jgi:DNA invertase Pin-like site-specific DNA recombinase
MLICYLQQVSSEADRQTTDLQSDSLLAADIEARHLFEDHTTGAQDNRPGLAGTLAFVRPADVLVVWNLDRLGRSLSHLSDHQRPQGPANRLPLAHLTKGMDTTTPAGELLFRFHVFGALARPVRTRPDARAGPRRTGRRPAPRSDGGRPRLLARSSTPSLVPCAAACRRWLCVATSRSNAPP